MHTPALLLSTETIYNVNGAALFSYESPASVSRAKVFADRCILPVPRINRTNSHRQWQMTATFATVKQKSSSGDALRELQQAVRFDLGSHKRTRLRHAGCGESGTILHASVSSIHAKALFREYQQHCRDISTDRLRYLTILHELVDLDGAAIGDSADGMRRQLTRLFDVSKVWALGVIEVELINFALLRRVHDQTDGGKRKMMVLERLVATDKIESASSRCATGTMALVHCHVLVDLNARDVEAAEAGLRHNMQLVNAWNRAPYQVELKTTFKNRTLVKNLTAIAEYGTKGGNEQLRFKTGFGRDLAEDLDAKMWRVGLGRKDAGGETVEDERGLSVGEVAFLDEVYGAIMDLSDDRRGYIVGSATGR